MARKKFFVCHEGQGTSPVRAFCFLIFRIQEKYSRMEFDSELLRFIELADEFEQELGDCAKSQN